MCGIVGYIGNQNAANILVDGLKRLEYRGYDSAGVAILSEAKIHLRRSVGKLPVLEGLLRENPIAGMIGLGHTRWATHGRPSEENAHPHTCCRGKIVVVHNGIIENYVELKNHLTIKGHVFKSQTDTEVLAHLIEESYTGDLLAAMRLALKQVTGSYAVGVMCADDDRRFIAARRDSPLVLGLGINEMFLASDVPALLPYTRKVIFLEDGDIAEIRSEQIKVRTIDGEPVERKPQTILWDAVMAEKAGFRHFMLKEIFEQRTTVRETFRSRISLEEGRVKLQDVLPRKAAESVSRVCLVACGTSYHSALVARYWFEEMAGIPCDVEIASEYRYRRSMKEPGTLVIAITQSGETADTLAALRNSRLKGLTTLAVCNAVGSTVTRDAYYTLYTHCGPEIGVASTKAFTGQLTALLLVALYLGQCRERMAEDGIRSVLQALTHLPFLIDKVLSQAGEVERIARLVMSRSNFLFLGRHLNYPIALEGALKLKEISYIHAEGYPAGEMKHGPIALIDENMPVVAIATGDLVRDKILSNMEEVKARSGMVIALATEGDEQIGEKADYTIWLPAVHEALTPILSILPLQLLAYYVAALRGCDIDQPRNLAKSVTVE
jgi:glucosamine--fructose-6-phosphate aminotransferase (isomerizing)